jgi:HEAT repeat protein
VLERTIHILLQACAGMAVAALLAYVLHEVWLRGRARRLRRRTTVLQDLLSGADAAARPFAALGRRPSTLRDLEALERLLEDRRRRLAPDAPADEVRALYESYDQLGIVEKYVRRLQHGRSWVERAFAARFLGEIGSARAVLPLIEVLRNTREEDRDVRLAAGRALGHIRDPRALEPLLQSLSAPESWLPARLAEVIVQFGDLAFEPLVEQLERAEEAAARAWAAEILGDLGNSKAVPMLVACLADLSDQVRARAASALGKLRDRRPVPDLIQVMLSDPVPYVRIQVVRALGAIGDPRALHHLVDALKDGEWWVRIRVVEALEQLGEQAVEPLYLALEDPDSEVRARAAVTLERLGVLDTLIERLAEVDPGAREKLLVAGQAGVVEVLIGALQHPDTRVRFVLTELLGEVRHPSVSAALLGRLQVETDPRVRAAVVRSLAQLQEQTAAEPISRLLGEQDQVIRVEAVRALERIHVAEPHVLLASAVRDPQPRVRAGAAVVLGKVGDERCIPPLLDLLGDGDAGVRTEAARALGLLRATPAVGRLMDAFKDFDAQVQIAAARALGQIGSPTCLETLVRGLEHASPELGSAIAWALGQIRWDDPERLIDVLFQGADRSSRLGALAALGQVQHEAGTELVRSMLSDADEEVVCEAVRILGVTQDRASVGDLLKLLHGPSEAARLAVLDALCRLRDPAALPAVRDAVSDPSPRVRARAVLALGALRDVQAGDLLRGVLAGQRSTPEMRHLALLGLMVLDREQDLPAILAGLEELRLYEFLHERARLSDVLLQQTVEAVRAANCVEFLVASARSRTELEDQLSGELSSAHSERRRVRVVRTLAILKSTRVYPAVWRTFYKDPSEPVRIAALEFLAELAPGEDFFRLLMDALNDLQPRVRAEALRRLGDIPIERVLPLLAPHLDSDDAELQAALVDYLAGLPEKALDGFLDGVLGGDPGRTARHLIIRVLGKAHHKGAPVLLETFLEDDDPDLRRAAMQVLAAVPSKRAPELIGAAMQDPDPDVRREALDAAAGLGPKAALPLLRQLLQDPAPALRRGALLHLARLRPRDAVDDFRTGMRDPEPRVRAAAIAGLVLEGGEPVEERMGPRDVPPVAEALVEIVPAEALQKKLASARVVAERIGALKGLFFRDARLRAQALATARLDPSPRVQVVAGRLQEILEVWLMDPQAAVWLGAAPAAPPGAEAPSEPADRPAERPDLRVV